MSYNASPLLDHVIGHLNIKNDAALARALEVAPPVISKLRHAKLSFGPSLILAIHETFVVPVAEIRRVVAS